MNATGTIEVDTVKIQGAATKYYKDLFEDSSAENTRHDRDLKELTSRA